MMNCARGRWPSEGDSKSPDYGACWVTSGRRRAVAFGSGCVKTWPTTGNEQAGPRPVQIPHKTDRGRLPSPEWVRRCCPTRSKPVPEKPEPFTVLFLRALPQEQHSKPAPRRRRERSPAGVDNARFRKPAGRRMSHIYLSGSCSRA